MYKSDSLIEYQKAINLRNDFGWGAKRISSFLSYKGIHVKHGTIASWLYFNKKPFDDKFTTFQKVQKNALWKRKF